MNAQDYECVLCHELLFQPSVLSCGHSFCQGCVIQMIKTKRANFNQCPICRRPQRFTGPQDVVVCKTFDELLTAAFPDLTAERAALMSTELERQGTSGTSAGADGQTQLPLFLLDPMLPKQRIDLHIFEPRYCRMIGEALEGSGRFGMCGYPAVGLVGHLGTEAEIINSVPLPGGRWNITCVGRRIFKIESLVPPQNIETADLSVANIRFVDLNAEDASVTATATSAATSGSSPGAEVTEAGEAAEEKSEERSEVQAEEEEKDGREERDELFMGDAEGVDVQDLSTGLGTLVDRWLALVKGTAGAGQQGAESSGGSFEAFSGHLARVMEDLESMPPASK